MKPDLVMPTTASPSPPEVSLDALLCEQHDLTAVERFSRWHDRAQGATHAPQYRDLIPLSLPQPGEQFAFEVDLEACSGCKACVTACHHFNGLDEHETWRSVGLLQAAESSLPIRQHVTTACHLCVEPTCLAGCPTQAYAKDAVTGIVRHLDDQCFGCQYCILMCPYEVPTYSPTRGIVRKCDMCRQRLAENELPACVQGCPNGAIAIRIVSQEELRERGAAGVFLPTAPNPSITKPSTIYRSSDTGSAWLVAGDHDQFHVAHAHWPLVFMLVLTQMSVGILSVGHLLLHGLEWLPGESCRAWVNVTAAITGLVGAQLALLHLGRPLQAYRAWLGWRTSWLSREVLAFGLYSPLVTLAAVGSLLPNSRVPLWLLGSCELAAIIAGAVAVTCSAMIYVATRRPWWSASPTFSRFAYTLLLLGNATCIAIAALTNGHALLLPLMIAGGAIVLTSLWLEQRWTKAALHDSEMTVYGPARLLKGELRAAVLGQRGCALVGAVLIPIVVMLLTAGKPGMNAPIIALTMFSLGLLLFSEICERYLFFAAVVASRMPGAIPR
jgi:formate dehydrogenase iron-sulfur subunit